MLIMGALTCTESTGNACSVTSTAATVVFATAKAALATFTVTVNTIRNPQSEYVSSAFSFTTYYMETALLAWPINQDTTTVTVLPNEYGDLTGVSLLRSDSSTIQTATNIDFKATNLNPVPANSIVTFVLSQKMFVAPVAGISAATVTIYALSSAGV